MRKRKKGRKLNRKKDQRRALLKSLAKALLEKERIKLPEARAKEVAPFVQKQITRAQKGTLQSQRTLLTIFPAELVRKLCQDIALRYKDRQGGYTRIIKLGPRKTDGAKMVFLELVK